MRRPSTRWTRPNTIGPAFTPTRRSAPLSASSAVEHRPLRPRGPLDLVRHALVNQVEELRHAGEERHLPLGEAAEQFGRVQRLEEDHARPDGEGQQQVGHLRQGVEERQHAEDAVLLGDRHDLERAFTLGQQVGMREHDALGVAGRARGVEDDAPCRPAPRGTAGGTRQRVVVEDGLGARQIAVVAVEQDDLERVRRRARPWPRARSRDGGGW